MFKKPILIFHPFFLALFPFLFLYSYNIKETSVSSTNILSSILPLYIITVILIVLIIYSINKLVIDIYKTSLIVDLGLLMFFSFGHFLKFFDFESINLIIIKVGGVKVLLILLSIFLILGSYFIIQTKLKLSEFNKFLNIMSVFLISIPSFDILTNLYLIENSNEYDIKNYSNENELRDSNIKNINKPDIYYIILDMYAGQKCLSNYYQYDNNEFILELEKRGFYVPKNSYSNYFHTLLSIPSSLNMDYIHTEFESLDHKNQSISTNIMRNNNVMQTLKNLDYKLVFSPSWAGPPTAVKQEDVDVYLDFRKNINEYKMVMWNYSFKLGLILNEKFVSLKRKLIANNESNRRGKIPANSDLRKLAIDQFNSISMIANQKDPKFIFSHIIMPHQPFIFDREGNDVFVRDFHDPFDDNTDLKKHYINQLVYTNKLVLEAIDSLISSDDKNKPIIIIQGDHGPDFSIPWERGTASNKIDKYIETLNILNAYYFPNGSYDKLYDNITPVNSFRIIFNEFFKTNYDLLEDKQYFSGQGEDIYDFVDVTQKLIDK